MFITNYHLKCTSECGTDKIMIWQIDFSIAFEIKTNMQYTVPKNYSKAV